MNKIFEKYLRHCFTIKSNRFTYLLFIIYIFPQISFSQHQGGNSNGFAFNALIQTSCPVLASDNDYIYFGGNANGFAVNSLTQSLCLPSSGTDIYFGGTSHGFAVNSLTQSVCPPSIDPNIYFGGISDGFSLNTLTQSVCLPLTSTEIYFGGISHGSTVNSLTQSICPPSIDPNIYFGGISHGFSINTLTQSAACLALPIQLLSFTANCKNGKVILEWTTASEINNDFFTIEKTLDAKNYSEVNRHQGAGNSSSTLNYSLTDRNPYNGYSYYRLKQTDFDGKTEVFDLVTVNCNNYDLSSVNIYPNPNNGKFKIEWLDVETTIEVLIYNNLGSLIWESETSSKTFNVDLSNNAKGIYFIHINSPDKSEVKKLIIE